MQDQPERPYLSVSQVSAAQNWGTGIAVAVTQGISLLRDALQSKGSERPAVLSVEAEMTA